MHYKRYQNNVITDKHFNISVEDTKWEYEQPINNYNILKHTLTKASFDLVVLHRNHERGSKFSDMYINFQQHTVNQTNR